LDEVSSVVWFGGLDSLSRGSLSLKINFANKLQAHAELQERVMTIEQLKGWNEGWWPGALLPRGPALYPSLTPRQRPIGDELLNLHPADISIP
jgi:hypothetical protein